MNARYRFIRRYFLALVAVGAALLLRQVLARLTGPPDLPTYITFYPAIMLVAVVAGSGPGVLATVTAALVVDYWVLAPPGQWGVARWSEAVGLALFTGMGILMSAVAGLYRRGRERLEDAVAARTAALHEANAQLNQEMKQRQQAGELLRQLNTELERRVAAQTTEIRQAQESLEQRVASRTAELQAANESLRAARIAALNLMEDALAARQQAQETERALRASEERLSIATDAAQLGIYDYQVPHGVIDWDPRVRDSWGIPPEEPVTYDAFLAGVHPADRTPTQAAVDKALDPAGDGHYYAEYRVISRADAGEKWVAATGQVFFDHGQAARMVGTVQDITQRRRAEVERERLLDERRRQSEFLEKLIANASIGVAVVGPDLRYMLANGTYEAVADGPVIGRTIAEVFPPTVAETVQLFVQQVLDSGQGMEFREYEVPLHGRTWWNVSEIPLRDAAGNTEAVLILTQEVTQQKLAAEALRESDHKHRSLFEHSMDAIFLTVPTGAVMAANQAACAMFGMTEEEICRYGRDQLVDPDDSRHAAAVEERTQVGKLKCELRYMRKDGTKFPAEVSSVVLDGGSRAFVILRDITERKRSEERMQASLAEKEVLLKEIHHRVKNNMQVISSLVALQAERVPEPAMRTVLEDVTHRVRSMALVHEKLYESTDLARIEFAGYAHSLLNYLWRAHSSTASGIRLAVDLEPRAISINAAVPCGLILNELVTNALKHAFRGRTGGEVAVSLRGTPEGRICLRVRDNGVGLPAGLDWRQADSLGLRLVQMLATQLRATVEVTSEAGTEFTVRFEERKP